MADHQNQGLPVEEEINLLDYWRVVWKYKRLIAILFSTTVLAAMTFSLLSPKIYESTATIITGFCVPCRLLISTKLLGIN